MYISNQNLTHIGKFIFFFKYYCNSGMYLFSFKSAFRFECRTNKTKINAKTNQKKGKYFKSQ